MREMVSFGNHRCARESLPRPPTPGLAPPRDALARGDPSRPISALGPSWPSNTRGPGHQSTVRGARPSVLFQRPRSYLGSPSDGQVGERAGGRDLECGKLRTWMPEPGRVASREWWRPGSTEKPGPNAANRGRSSEMVIVVHLLRWLKAGIALGSPNPALIFGMTSLSPWYVLCKTFILVLLGGEGRCNLQLGCNPIKNW